MKPIRLVLAAAFTAATVVTTAACSGIAGDPADSTPVTVTTEKSEPPTPTLISGVAVQEQPWWRQNKSGATTTMPTPPPPTSPTAAATPDMNPTSATGTASSAKTVTSVSVGTQRPPINTTFRLDGDILFEADSASLTVSAGSQLDALIAILQQHLSATVDIAGNVSSDLINDPQDRQLSTLRAQSVAAYLAQRGIATNRIRAHGDGANDPVAPNDTQAHRRLNRRCDIAITEP